MLGDNDKAVFYDLINFNPLKKNQIHDGISISQNA